MRFSSPLPLCVFAFLCACGLGAAPGGGDDHLPTAGLGPYGKPDPDSDTPAEEPYVVAEAGVNLADPSALRRDDGSFDVWYTRTDPDDGSIDIYHSHLADVTERPDAPPALALAASADWQEGVVRRPGVVALPDGHLAMYYQAGVTAPVIGRATGDPDGPWADNGMVATGISDPAALVLGDRILLYGTAASGRAIVVAESTDGQLGLAFEDFTTVLDGSDDLSKFDSVGAAEPAVIGGTTEAGQTRVFLFYVGEKIGGTRAIGSAVSDDGLGFVRFFNGDAILDPGNDDERGPSPVLAADRGWLFYGQKRVSVGAIAVALHP